MLKFFAAIAGASISIAVTSAAAADAPPKAVDILFETKHIATIAAGTELLYKFERKPSDEAMMGPGFTDQIKVKVEKDAPEGKKDVVVSMYTGERAHDPNKIPGMDSNPMLIVYLDTALGHFNQLVGGDRAYLKHKFSLSFEKEAKVDAVKVDYKGQEVDGYRVSVTPFANDPSRAKMRGFEGSTFSIVISDKVPGQFVQMISNYMNSDKSAPTLEERTTLDGVGGIK